MNIESGVKHFISILFFIIVKTSLWAQPNFFLKSFTSSVEGTSNVRDWKSAITNITCTGILVEAGQKLVLAKNVELKILVESIKGTEGKSMDIKTYEAFRYKQHPYIIYTFISAVITGDTKNNLYIDPVGDLTMGGVKRKTAFSGKGRVLPNGNIQLKVSKKLNLRDFNIEPPTAYLGAVKVADEVILNFDLVLEYKIQTTK